MGWGGCHRNGGGRGRTCHMNRERACHVNGVGGGLSQECGGGGGGAELVT